MGKEPKGKEPKGDGRVNDDAVELFDETRSTTLSRLS